MKVQFATAPAARLNDVPVVNGQIVSISDGSGYYYDMGGVRRPAAGVVPVSSLPIVGQSNLIYLLLLSNKAKCYVWNATSQDYLIVGGDVDVEAMTYSAYDQLSTAEKNDGTIRFVTNKPGNVANVIYLNSVEWCTAPSLATTQQAGIVKVDGTSITIDNQGTISGLSAASEIAYSNTTSHMVATTVQAAIDELKQSSGGSTAATTSYNNATSGLQATNVQAAIDELLGKITTLEAAAARSLDVETGNLSNNS